MIVNAIPEATSESWHRNLWKLNNDLRVLYNIITDAGEITPGDLYDQYVKQVNDPKIQRMIRSYMKKIEHYNPVVAESSTRNRIYKPVG